jgi:hypothetical protein
LSLKTYLQIDKLLYPFSIRKMKKIRITFFVFAQFSIKIIK